MKRFPDTIVITRKAEFIQDEDGYFEPDGEGTTFTSECRAEPANKKPEKRGRDGNIIDYTWDVFMPHTEEVFSIGDGVEITKPNGEVHSGTVKGNPGYQLNTVLWV